MANATVSVICKKDDANPDGYSKTFNTDNGGHFYAEIKGFKMCTPLIVDLDHTPPSCTVHLFSSNFDNCTLLSNINKGIEGATLRYEDKRLSGFYYEAVIYAAGPLAFFPADC